jgi:hypothetical protein
MDSLDAVLQKYTSEVENHLHGATFVAVDAKGIAFPSQFVSILNINPDF